MLWELSLLFFLILLNGFFALSELAVVSSRRSALEHMVDQGRVGARAALELAEDPSRFLSTIQIGISLVGVLAGAYGGATFSAPLADALANIGWLAPHSEVLAFALVVAAITYVTLVIGELVPKRLALSRPEALAVVVAPPMRLLSRVVAPLVWFLSQSMEVVLRLLRAHRPGPSVVTEEEVKALIAEGTRTGVFVPAEKDLINGVLRLADRSVRTVMVPRGDITWLDVEDPPEAIRREIIEAGFSRFPVARGEIDELLGIVHTKDILDRLLKDEPFDLEPVLLKPPVIPESATVLRTLEMFKQSPVHMAFVVDEYGTIEGLVTLSDVTGAIAGEIPEPGEKRPEAVRRPDGSWLMDGRLPIDEVEQLLNVRGMRGEEYDTLAGFVLAEFGRLPEKSDCVTWKDVRFEVVDMDERRIDQLLVTPLNAQQRQTGA